MKKTKLLRWFGLASVTLLSLITLAGCGQKKASANSQAYQSDLVKKGTLTVACVGNLSPYSYRKDGKLDGFEVAIGKELAKRSGLKVKFVNGTWDALVTGISGHKFDVLLNNVVITPARQKQFRFAAPYLYSHDALLTSKSNTTLNTLKDVKGKRLAANSGSPTVKLIKDNGGTPVDIWSQPSQLDAVRQKRVDGTITSWETWAYLKKTHKTAGIRATEVPSKDAAVEKWAPLLNKNSKNLQKQLSKVINQMHKDGTLTKLSNKYIGIDATKKD